MLKRVRARVAGAEEMHEAEHSINVLATKAAGDAVAPFLGYTLVESPVRGAAAGAGRDGRRGDRVVTQAAVRWPWRRGGGRGGGACPLAVPCQ